MSFKITHDSTNCEEIDENIKEQIGIYGKIQNCQKFALPKLEF